MAEDLRPEMGGDPYKLSPHQIVFATMAMRERQKAAMVRHAIADSVKDMKTKDRKKWFKDHGVEF